jgi:hypothetical protein
LTLTELRVGLAVPALRRAGTQVAWRICEFFG